jgi:hypothetical protein
MIGLASSMFSIFSSGARVVVLAIAVWLSMASPARAASLPPRAEIGLTSGVEAEVFRQLVLNRYHVEYRIVVAADVDRDGDLDVLASTDRTVTVWVNDGAGHLRAHRLPHGPAMEFCGPGNSWRGREDRAEPTIQGNGQHSPVCVVRAHAPPRSDVCARSVASAATPVGSHARCSSPRAPPA